MLFIKTLSHNIHVTPDVLLQDGLVTESSGGFLIEGFAKIENRLAEEVVLTGTARACRGTSDGGDQRTRPGHSGPSLASVGWFGSVTRRS
jgi:hypothetical protein